MRKSHRDQLYNRGGAYKSGLGQSELTQWYKVRRTLHIDPRVLLGQLCFYVIYVIHVYRRVDCVFGARSPELVKNGTPNIGLFFVKCEPLSDTLKG